MEAQEELNQLNLNPTDFPCLTKWKDKDHLLKTLQGIAKASQCSLETAAVNLELDLSMM